MRNEQQVARHVRVSGRGYVGLFLHADLPRCRVVPRSFCAVVVVALDSQPLKGDGTYRGVASLAACHEGEACQQMLEFEGYRTGSLACHDGNTRLFRRHQVVPFRGVEAVDGKSAVRAGDRGHGIAQRLRGWVEGVEVVGVTGEPVSRALVTPHAGKACHLLGVKHARGRTARHGGIAAPNAERVPVGLHVVCVVDGGSCHGRTGETDRQTVIACLHVRTRAFRTGSQQAGYSRYEQGLE